MINDNNEFQKMGPCDECGDDPDTIFPVFAWRDKWVCKICLDFLKSTTEAKAHIANRPVDEFNENFDYTTGEGKPNDTLGFVNYKQLELDLNGATPVDNSANSHTITNSGAVAAEPGFTFVAGETDYMTLPASNAIFTSDSKLTVLVWFAYSGAAAIGTDQTIFQARSAAGTAAIEIYFDNATNSLIAAYLDDDSVMQTVTIATRAALVTATWHLISITFDGTTWGFYLDKEIIAIVVDDFEGVSGDTAAIGYRASDTDKYYSGLIGYVRCLNRVMQVGEIRGWYNGSKAEYGL